MNHSALEMNSNSKIYLHIHYWIRNAIVLFIEYADIQLTTYCIANSYNALAVIIVKYTTVFQYQFYEVVTRDKELLVTGGQAIMTGSGEWVQYSSPFEGGAEYVAICLPAFSMDAVKRDE